MFKAELEVIKFEEDIITASEGIILPDHDWETEESGTYSNNIYSRLLGE